jgi:hypothetical protein
MSSQPATTRQADSGDWIVEVDGVAVIEACSEDRARHIAKTRNIEILEVNSVH